MYSKQYQLNPGTILDNRYVIQGVLGEGGFGITYDAENQSLGMRVAIKEFFCRDYMSRDTENSNEATLFDLDSKEHFEKEKHRFLEEARILGSFINEPGIVDVTDYFEENGTAYIVMRFLEGVNLREYVEKNGPMDYIELFSKMPPLLETLGKVHEAGLIHGDITPDNIMLLSDGSLCLIDFGASYKYDKESKSYVINVGKSGFTAPEQHSDEALTGPQTDIYALSATIYYCLTSKNPEASVSRMLMNQERVKPSDTGITLPKEVDEAISKGLSLKPNNRFADVKAMQKSMGVFNREATKTAGNSLPVKWIAVGFVAVAIIIGLLASSLFKTTKTISGDVYHISFKARENMTVRDYYDALEIMKGRLDLLLDDTPYSLEVNEDRIELQVPKESVDIVELQNKLEEYIARAGNLYAFNLEYTIKVLGEIGFVLDNPRTDTLIQKKEIESVELKNGNLSWIDVSDLGLADPNNYDYLVIELTESGANRLRSTFAEWGDELRLGFDSIENVDTLYFFYTFPYDYKTIYCIMEDQYGELVKHILLSDSMASSFDYSLDLNDQTEWTKAESKGESNFLSAPEDVEEPNATIKYSLYSLDEYTEDFIIELKNEIEKRMDCLGHPYAYGFVQDPESKNAMYATFKLPVHEIGLPILPILFTTRSDIELVIGLSSYDLDSDNYTLSYQGNSLILEDSNSAYNINVPLAELTKSISSSNPTYAYICIGGKAFYGALLTNPISDNKIIFNIPCVEYKGDPEQNGLIDLVMCIWDYSYDKPYLPTADLEAVQMNRDKDGVKAVEKDFGYIESDLEELEGLIKEIWADSDVFTNGTEDLFCRLRLPVDGDLPSKGAELSEKIYESIAFSERPYTQLWIALTDEDGLETERARLLFSKDYGYKKEGRIRLECYYSGGRLEDTRDRMKEVLESDEFFRGFYDGEVVIK